MHIDTSYRTPNISSRGGRPVSLIVLHATVGAARSARAWLTNPTARVSCHYVVDKSGRIYQLADDSACTWHAGRAEWRGERFVNEVSIGIEIENANDGRDPYPAAQLDAVRELTRVKIDTFGIVAENITRHRDVAVPRGRKSDPAGFPWEQFRSDVGGATPQQPTRPERPVGAAERRTLGEHLLREAYQQVGAVEWPEWAMSRAARTASLGLPIGPSFECVVGARNFIAQAFGKDVLVSPIGDWRAIQRLSSLTLAAQQPLRDVVLQRVYAQIGESFRTDWAFHQYALRSPIGPPIGTTVRIELDSTTYVVAPYALDTLYAPVNQWQAIGTLQTLHDSNDRAQARLAEALLDASYRRAGSRLRSEWPITAFAQRERLGAPLGPAYRVRSGARDYVAEAYALDVVYCPIGDWSAIQRAADLL